MFYSYYGVARGGAPRIARTHFPARALCLSLQCYLDRLSILKVQAPTFVEYPKEERQIACRNYRSCAAFSTETDATTCSRKLLLATRYQQPEGHTFVLHKLLGPDTGQIPQFLESLVTV